MEEFTIVNPRAAAVDVGAECHYAAVSPGSDPEGRDVREFSAFTDGLQQLCDWLQRCGTQTVALESTGVYWIPLYELLESEGLQPCLVDARHVQNVSGRKSDVLDCQWLQQLHSFGLLSAAFRPEENICVLRSYMRHRGMLVKSAADHIQHMQKALTQMNLKLQHAVSDLAGQTGLRIIRAIVGGERNPAKLATLRDPRCAQPEAVIAAALKGSYRAEHLFALKQALELYDFYQKQIAECDQQIEAQLQSFEDQSGGGPVPPNGKRARASSGNAPAFNLRESMYRAVGVDLTAIPSLDALSVSKLIAEIGTDPKKWRDSAASFCAWMRLCPGTRISGKKRLSGRMGPAVHRAGQILRVAAQTLHRSKTALGAQYRAMRAKFGPVSANVICAHKLGRIIFAMLKSRKPYREVGEAGYDAGRRKKALRQLERRAKALGFTLQPC